MCLLLSSTVGGGGLIHVSLLPLKVGVRLWVSVK